VNGAGAGEAVTVLHGGGALACRVYLVAAAGRALVLDAGAPAQEPASQARLAELGLPLASVIGVWLTHEHVDHATGAAAWLASGVPVHASPLVARRLAEADPGIWREHPERLRPTLLSGHLAPGMSETIGDLTVEILATPGHTAGSLSFGVVRGAQRVACCGDLVMADGNPGWAGGPEFSVAATLASLRLLRAWRPTRLCTGHNEVTENLDAWLAAVIARGEAGQWQLKR
jgi:glyoxylase-like metal-dependent hydrolase (beta-lactamase superfamily II)